MASFDARQASRLFASLIDGLGQRGWLQEWFGKDCPDNPEVGRAGHDPAAFVERRTFRSDIWYPSKRWEEWDTDVLLTAVEFFHDHVSLPTEGWYHGYDECGYHATGFDAAKAHLEYRSEVNAIISHLEEGYELLSDGEVVRQAPDGYETLLAAAPPPIAGKDYQGRVASAIKKFRSRTSSTDDRRHAVRDLADVLELLRPELKHALTRKDDTAIFELANNFAIRHFNDVQHKDYDPIWFTWMFYFYLATVHAVAHLSRRDARATSDQA